MGVESDIAYVSPKHMPFTGAIYNELLVAEFILPPKSVVVLGEIELL